MEVPHSKTFKLPTIETFDGTTDPYDHLSAYKHQTYVQAVDNATWCKNFSATLKEWLISGLTISLLIQSTIFTELSCLFTSHFVANREDHKTSMHLGKVV